MRVLERPKVRLGIIPLVDCAPIVLAEELGAFERHGLEVEIHREASWATIRDKVALGLLDAAQMLAPMPLAATLGIDGVRVPMIAAMTLDLNGNAITLGQTLWREIEETAPQAAAPLDARILADVVRRRARAGQPPLALASVFPFSSHNYLLRLWLASGGIDPDRDLRLSVVPPPHMIAHLSAGVIDGYCVGEPWNQQAEQLGIGRIALTGQHLWKAMPEKVLGTAEAWAQRHPDTLAALVKALIEACAWLDEPANRAEAARVLASPRYVNAPVEVIARSLAMPGFHIFHRGDANFPWRSHADWFLAQMVRWGQAAPGTDLAAIADRVFRPDLFRAAASALGASCPAEDRKPRGAHGEPELQARREPMPSTTTRIGRRTILKSATATAALMGMARASFPSGAFAQGSGPETSKVKLGFIALTDAAPLIVAKEKKIFDKHGITDANVAKQASWGTTRDNLVLGSAAGGIDGAHLLTPLPYLISLGTVTSENRPTPMHILARLSYQCQGLSVAKELESTGARADASPLREAFARNKAAGQEVKCAMTFPGGTHDLWLRYWLAAGGVDPDRDVSTIVVPPAQMVANMKVGNMAAFCVGEPWNDQLVHQDIGYTAATTGEIWKDHPEKSLGLRADWVDRNPKAAMAVLMAVMEAQQWCEKMENKDEMAAIISKRQWLNVPPADIVNRIKGDIDYGDGRKVAGSDLLMKFWKGGVSYPYQSHELWFLIENQRWGKLPADLDTRAIIGKVNREDLWRQAARTIGAPEADVPKTTSRGKEAFFDGKVFDPEDPGAYLASLQIKKVS